LAQVARHGDSGGFSWQTEASGIRLVTSFRSTSSRQAGGKDRRALCCPSSRPFSLRSPISEPTIDLPWIRRSKHRRSTRSLLTVPRRRKPLCGLPTAPPGNISSNSSATCRTGWAPQRSESQALSRPPRLLSGCRLRRSKHVNYLLSRQADIHRHRHQCWRHESRESSPAE